jgi:plasmid stability protein
VQWDRLYELLLRTRESYGTFMTILGREGTVVSPIHINITDQRVCKALSERAARNGKSASEEAIDILQKELCIPSCEPEEATTLFLNLMWEDTRTPQEILDDFPRFRRDDD